MNNLLDQHGYFWWHNNPIPEGKFAPDSCIPGILRIGRDGSSELELHGVLSEHPFAIFERAPLDGEICIQGKLKGSSRSVLLMGLHHNGGGLSTDGISHEKFHSTGCLVSDKPFSSRVRAGRFGKLEIDLKGFEEWLGVRSIKLRKLRNGLNAEYRKPKDIFYPTEGGRIFIKFGLLAPTVWKDCRQENQVSFSESTCLQYWSKVLLSLGEMRKKFSLVEEFFMLITNAQISLEWPVLFLGRTQTRCTYYFSRTKNDAKRLLWTDCWTLFPQLEASLGTLFSEWIEKREVYGPGFYLYLGTKRGVKLYQEHQFVNLVWGLESFHRKKIGTKNSQKLTDKVQRIINQISLAKDKTWLEQRLKSAAEPSLSKRLFEVLSAMPLDLDKNKLENFSERCAEARNDISHFGGQRHPGEYSEFVIKISKLSDALSNLYHLLLLHEIGLDVMILKSAYKGPRSYEIKASFAEAGLL